VPEVRHEQQVLLGAQVRVEGRELARDADAARTASGSRTMSWPAILASPASAADSVARIRTIVVLPALLRVLCCLARGN
jgi:hypothetical protein